MNWASQQKRDDDFSDFVNPATPASKNSLYNGWQGEYKNRLRKNGFEENQANKLGSEEPDSYFQELSNAGSDENWYRNFGNDGRDVSGDGSSNESRSTSSDLSGSSRSDSSGSSRDRSSTTSDENSDCSDAEGQTSRRRRTGEEELSSR